MVLDDLISAEEEDSTEDEVQHKIITGWNATLELDNYLSSFSAERRLIQLADERFPLSSVINNYSINFHERYSPSGWTLEARCPFRDHRDDTPSFGYNQKEGKFNCFGCGRGGKITKFISWMESKSQLEVAKELFLRFGSADDVIIELEDRDHNKIDDLLQKFSVDVNSFLRTYENVPGAFEFAETITQALDIYLANTIVVKPLLVESLSNRLDKLRYYLNNYKVK